jgi:hypothetical protein
LLACGYAGEVPVTSADLSNIFMALYQSSSGGADSKVLSDATGSSLVASSGSQALPAHLKGLIGGQGILLSESETDITITANATPIATIGSGLALIDPTSTPLTKDIASIAVANGLTISRNAGVITFGLGTEVTMRNLQSPSGISSITNQQWSKHRTFSLLRSGQYASRILQLCDKQVYVDERFSV